MEAFSDIAGKKPRGAAKYDSGPGDLGQIYTYEIVETTEPGYEASGGSRYVFDFSPEVEDALEVLLHDVGMSARELMWRLGSWCHRKLISPSIVILLRDEIPVVQHCRDIFADGACECVSYDTLKDGKNTEKSASIILIRSMAALTDAALNSPWLTEIAELLGPRGADHRWLCIAELTQANQDFSLAQFEVPTP